MEALKSIDINKIKTDFKKYPNTIFWIDSGGEYLAEYNWSLGKFWISYRKIWKEYEAKYSWSEIKDLLKSEVEKKFYLDDILVNPATTDGVKPIEDHFGNRGNF